MSRHSDLVSTPAMRAALALRESLPTRTHTRPAPQEGSGGPRHMQKGAYQRGKAMLFGKGGIARPIRIGKTVYASASECARKRHCSTRDLYQWLRDGHTRAGIPCHYVSEESGNGR